jgi:hypothetical protein
MWATVAIIYNMKYMFYTLYIMVVNIYICGRVINNHQIENGINFVINNSININIHVK